MRTLWAVLHPRLSVAVDEATGRVFITGRADGQLELIGLGARGTPVPR